MTVAVSPVLNDVYAAVGNFIEGIIPGVPVVAGLGNRSAMPLPGFILMQALFQNRLRWNIDSWDSSNPATANGTSEQGIELRMQIDCYGPSSCDWANTISTLFRDPYGCAALAPNCQPLYADDARMMPLVDAEAQYEQRWTLDAHIQWNPVVTVTQDFANSVEIDLINANQEYPVNPT